MELTQWLVQNFTESANSKELTRLLSGKTQKGSDGFLCFTDSTFDVFKAIPHLFAKGQEFLDLVNRIEGKMDSADIAGHKASLQDTLNLIRNLIFSANVTAPSDLWLIKNILSSYAELGILTEFGAASIGDFVQKHNLDERVCRLDMAFLESRGLFKKLLDGDVDWIIGIPSHWPRNFVPLVRSAIDGEPMSSMQEDLLQEWQSLATVPLNVQQTSWEPGVFEIEMGYRVLTLVLALRTSRFYQETLNHERFVSANSKFSDSFIKCLSICKFADGTGKLTRLGSRVLRRGPGPFGITHAYHPYMEKHLNQLKGKTVSRWISRAENVAASQEANAKSFAGALSGLAKYCQDAGFKYKVFIEHAVGQGEATRQHFEKFGEDQFQYFGADLEQKAIEQTQRQKDLGRLPGNMILIAGADIGMPEYLIQNIRKHGFETNQAVMVVGNGFHEVRHQSDEMMSEVFRKYCQAGILLIFTEETGLSSDEILLTAWNTYHAGFRYLHELSGQGLRPFSGIGSSPRKLSWNACAEAGGYQVLEKYTTLGRRILPIEASEKNPPISANYFCVPRNWIQRV